MTEQLKTLMDKAADLDFAVVDVDAITSAGDRTVRRRRIAIGVAGVAALAVVATGAVLLGGDDGDRKTDFVDDPLVTDVPMWTEGSTLHTPDGTFDLGVDVISFIRTSAGVVFLGWEGESDVFGVYSFTGEGEPTRIGESQDSQLRADPTQPYAGWLDGTGKDLEAVVYDQSAGERAWSVPAKAEYSFPIVAIDDHLVYLADADEGAARVLDLESGEMTALSDIGAERHLVAAGGGMAAYGVFDSDDGSSGLEVGPISGDGVVLDIPDATDRGAFSPDGRWFSVFDDQVTVFDTATGEPVEVDPGDYPNSLGYEWLDDDTLMAIAGSEEAGDQIALLSCELPAGTCTEVTRLAGFGAREFIAIGLGEAIWGIASSEGSASEPIEVEASEAPATSSTDRPE